MRKFDFEIYNQLTSQTPSLGPTVTHRLIVRMQTKQESAVLSYDAYSGKDGFPVSFTLTKDVLNNLATF